MRAINQAGNGYAYLGSLRCKVNGNITEVESIPFAAGRIIRTSNGYQPKYYIKDHLGSTRAIVNQDGETVEALFDYMPYGTEHKNTNAPTTDSDYGFTGKEKQGFFGLDEIYDSFARFQTNNGRFISVDPLAYKFPWSTTYSYCAGNPVNIIDPDGMEPQKKNEVTVWSLIEERIKTMFSINIDGSSSTTIEQSKQQIEENINDIETATEAVNIIAEGGAMLNPLGAVISTTVKATSGQQVTAMDVTYSVAELLPAMGVVKDGGKIFKTAGSILEASDALRIENAATRIGKPINVVGSRASGTAGAFSDWDYIIEGINKQNWNKIKNSLPGSKSHLDNTPKNIDLIRTTLDPTRPHITIYPKR